MDQNKIEDLVYNVSLLVDLLYETVLYPSVDGSTFVEMLELRGDEDARDLIEVIKDAVDTLQEEFNDA